MNVEVLVTPLALSQVVLRFERGAAASSCSPSDCFAISTPAVAQSRYRAAARHRTGPSGRRAIQVIQSAVTVPGGIGLSHRSTGAYGPSQSGRLQVGRPPLLLHRHGTGPRPQDRAMGPAGHSSYTVRGHGPGRDRTQSPKHWRVRTVPVRKTSSWAPPAAQAVAP